MARAVMRPLGITAVLGLAVVALGHTTMAGPPGPARSNQSTEMLERINLPIKTVGGTQFWTDYVWREGYRIQQNSVTDHWRLLDPSDVRRAWGSREQCERELEKLCPRSQLADQPRHFVVLLHGLMRTRRSMRALEDALRQAGYEDMIRMSYASTRRSISEQALALRELLEGLPAGSALSFVGHSMGNIVTRRMLGDLQRDGDPAGLLPRCRAMVMLGPPNQGAAIARLLAPTGLYGLITGPGGLELGPGWQDFVERLATPPFPFAIVIGDVSNRALNNPLLKEKSDFIVTVEEARLPGAEEEIEVSAYHSFLPRDRETIDATIAFLDKH